MTDRHLVANEQAAPARAVGTVVSDVEDRAILDIAGDPDFDALDVASDYRSRPNRYIVGERHCTDDDRGWIDKYRCAQLRPQPAVGPDRPAIRHRNVTSSSADVG